MPFRLKNAPLEFQHIMNDIFNPYSEFIIVYIDDDLIYSTSVDQHFKHIICFKHIAHKNCLVVSAPKIKLFQIKIRFLGHDIFQGTIKPISRPLEFASKFQDVIKDTNQLQRFLGCLNYVSDIFPKVRHICAPLYKRLQKQPVPLTYEHTKVVQILKQKI